VTSNAEIARQLDRVGDLLDSHEANPFRVRSYRRAADELRSLRVPVARLYGEGGCPELQRIPGVGQALSSAIAEILDTGALRLLERLEAQAAPEDAFARLPGVGPKLARRIHDELGVTTLEELEVAAHDGRLEAVEGIGEKRAGGIRDVLAARLARSRRTPPRPVVPEVRPSVALLLEVDREYRDRARQGGLRRIAPRRFNPAGEAWLPIMEVERAGWDFTALFSNTQRAHELGRTRDWVVIYYHRDGDAGQCTVVSARSGRLRELRVVRGREAECRRHYQLRKIA
jgi:Holliday junction resolvasome RuvABC DNA-binding subunit